MIGRIVFSREFCANVPLGPGAFSFLLKFGFGLTIEHWQFDMICQKWCSVYAISSGLETDWDVKKYKRKSESINSLIYSGLFFSRKSANCGTGFATEIGRDKQVTTTNQQQEVL